MNRSDFDRRGTDESGATFSPCGLYRYHLWRVWAPDGPQILFIGLNPSTADEKTDDNTIRRCIGFAKEWKAGGVHMVNLFALRSTDPRGLKEAADPIGPENDDVLKTVHGLCHRSIAAWGNHGAYKFRSSHVRVLLGTQFLWCFGKTSKGEPKHPLYLPKTAVLERVRR